MKTAKVVVREMKLFVNHGNLNKIAYLMGYSPKYLSRIFKEFEQQDFREFRIKVKMEEAKVLLRNSDFSVTDIAGFLGYRNPESFSRQFKRTVGIVPTKYLRR